MIIIKHQCANTTDDVGKIVRTIEFMMLQNSEELIELLWHILWSLIISLYVVTHHILNPGINEATVTSSYAC